MKRYHTSEKSLRVATQVSATEPCRSSNNWNEDDSHKRAQGGKAATEQSSPPQRRSRGTASFRRGTPPFPAKWRGMAAKIGSTNSLKPLRPIFSSSRAEGGKPTR